MKNYVVKFMDKTYLAVTAQEAAKIAIDWQRGATAIFINGNLKASHQICSIDQIDKQEEKDLCERYGLSEPPRIETFLSANKQLKDGRNR